MTLFFCIVIYWNNSAPTNHSNILKMLPIFFLLKSGGQNPPSPVYAPDFISWWRGVSNASSDSRREAECHRREERGRAMELPPSTCWWWSVRISHIWSNAPAMPSKWVLSPPHREPPPPRPDHHPTLAPRATAQIMPCCQAWEEAEGGARFIISSRWQAAGRRKIGSYLVSSDICVWLCNSDLDSALGKLFSTLQLANQLAHGFICCFEIGKWP